MLVFDGVPGVFIVSALVLLFAFIVDRIFGEPPRFHPLVGFGHYAQRLEIWLNPYLRDSAAQMHARLTGGIALTLAVAPFVLLVFLFSHIHYYISWVLDVLVLYFCIAYKSLHAHSLAVFNALEQNDIVQAREKVSMIVSRDSDEMAVEQVRKAAIESTLENGADAIFSPVFWFLVGGAPLVLLHRLVNTLDAMWGYKTERYLEFGYFAARFDDLLNYIPARLVAISYALVGDFKLALRAWREQAHTLDSPNAGPVMAAGAGALSLRLGGDAHYHGVLEHRPEFGFGRAPENTDISRALSLVRRVLCLWAALLVIVWLFYV